jgi:hypothetical protein
VTITTEAPLPQPIAQQRNTIAVRDILLHGKSAALEGRNPKQLKKSALTWAERIGSSFEPPFKFRIPNL